MATKKKDHWNALASLLGMAPAEPEQPEMEPVTEATSQPEADMTVEAEPLVELPPVAQERESGGEFKTYSNEEMTPTPARPAPAPAKAAAPAKPARAATAAAPPAPPQKKKRDHWGSVLGHLGLAVPEPEPEPEIVVEEAAEPVVDEPPPVVVPEPDSPEAPAGYAGPDLFERTPSERMPADRSRDRSRRGRTRDAEPPARTRDVEPGRPRDAEPPARTAPRPTREDEFEFDDDLNSGIQELWDDHRKQQRPAEPPAAPIWPAVEHDDEEEDLPVRGKFDDRDEEAGEDGTKKKRRRRRRRRRGERTGEEVAPPRDAERAPTRSERGPRADDDLDDDIVDDFDDDVEEVDLLRDELPARPASRAGGPPRPERKPRPAADDDEGPKRKRRRRTRREEPEARRTEADHDDRYLDDHDDDLDAGPASLGSMADRDKLREAHKQIPTWDEAIGVIVTANLDARKSSPGPRRGDDRPRRDDGRGRGGRR